MSSAVQNILQRTIGDGARATKFEAYFAFTDTRKSISGEELVAMCKTASFPGKSHTRIDLKYKGRNIPIKGQTKYSQSWDCVFYLSEDHRLKKSLEEWVEALDQKHNYGGANKGLQQIHNKNSSYTTDIIVTQKNFNDDTETAKYTLHNAFPTEISAVQTNYDGVTEISEFTVTFSYSNYTMESIKAKNGNFVDELVEKIDNARSEIVESVTTTLGLGTAEQHTKLVGPSVSEEASR